MIDRNEIAIKVRQIIGEQMAIEPDSFDESARIMDDLNADSLDALELVLEFGDEFEFVIADDDADRLLTVANVIDHVHDKLKQLGRAE